MASERELERYRQPPGQLLDDGALGPEGLPQVPSHHAPEPLDVLDVERPVQAELGPHLGQVPGVRLLLEHEGDDVARDQPGQREDEE